MTPRKLSHYEIREERSRGGMGIVSRALDVKLEREVALKILLPDLVKNEIRKRRFIQEAKAAAALKHPNIAVIYEIDDAEDETFIAMEHIEGWKLSDLLARERLSISRATAMAVEILEGLSSAHEKGIVHRDLKPANLMVTKDGHIKIIDFGLAKLVERVPSVNDADSDAQTKVKGDTQEGQVLGTVAYMSPGQAACTRVGPPRARRLRCRRLFPSAPRGRAGASPALYAPDSSHVGPRGRGIPLVVPGRPDSRLPVEPGGKMGHMVDAGGKRPAPEPHRRPRG